jgi:hypothetical protein
MVFFLLNRSQKTATQLSMVTLGVSLVCAVCWIAAIRPRGEAVTAVTGFRWNPNTLETLSQQLEGINRALSRLVQKT